MSCDSVYRERAHLVAALCKVFPASLEAHEHLPGQSWDPAWATVVIVDLPSGQVSWHLHVNDLDLFEHVPYFEGRKWDGHDTALKYRRLDALK